jgi:hypothetical protein
MNLLKNTRCYLAGSVEQSNTLDEATSWRQDVALFLSEIGVKAYDPLIKPPWLDAACHINPSAYLPIINGEKEPGYYEHKGDKVWVDADVSFETNRKLRITLLRIANAADWIICFLPKKFTAGTFDEVYAALRRGSPVFFCCPDGILSTWMLAAATNSATDISQYFFGDWESLKEHISAIDKGLVKIDPVRWVFLAWREEDWPNPLSRPDWRD